jgi:aminoglycoside phosphotransferase (APT) family kinase protein
MADATVPPIEADAAIPVEALTGYFRQRLAADASIVSATVASEGMSDDTWMVDVSTGAGLEQFVVRRYRSGGVLREETDSERHFRILSAIPSERIPVPEVLWFEPDPEIAGGPFFVMRRVSGRIVVPWLPEGRAFLAEAGEGPLGEEFVSTLAAIHGLEWRGTDLEFLAEEAGAEAADDPTRRVEAMRAVVERYRIDPEPVLVDALGWLEHNKPEQLRTALVHGDYRTGNIVFGEDGINAVLDWEFARVGDPAADLAWLLTRTNSMGSDLACYILERERVLELYEKHAGWVPSGESLRFWEVLEIVRNTSLWLSSEYNYLNGATSELTLARWSYALPNLRSMLLDALEEA